MYIYVNLRELQLSAPETCPSQMHGRLDGGAETVTSF